MALAWNAGWVNSPRGFKSRILRHGSAQVSGRARMHDSGPAGLYAGVNPGSMRDRGRSMGRTWAIVGHASLSIIAGVLYFFCVLPRWSELMGETAHALGMAGRIASGAVIGLAALPVVFTLLRTRKPELGTPQLALSIRLWSIVAHVLAGVLIIGTAISEIWLSLDAAGQWLFGIYGAAAAIAVLGIFAFYLSFVAELPPPPPKPIKAKEPKRRARAGRSAARTRPRTPRKPTSPTRSLREADDAESGADEITETEAVETGEAETTEVELSEPEAKEAEAETAEESVDATVESAAGHQRNPQARARSRSRDPGSAGGRRHPSHQSGGEAEGQVAKPASDRQGVHGCGAGAPGAAGSQSTTDTKTRPRPSRRRRRSR